eukprot:GHVL01021660.1.p2 GENE.GHVL01021660.1~~GHVL01021660.1.p2  ORF type:complete len:265 (-),score=34.35 GHVL01021660.1:161-955(-)
MMEQREALKALMLSLSADDKSPNCLDLMDHGLCQYFLSGLCPHTLFENTKNYLGPCEKIHNEHLQKQYLTDGPKHFQNRCDSSSLRYLLSLINQCDRRIERAKRRIQQQTSECDDVPSNEALNIINQQLSSLIDQVKSAGDEGKIDECLSIFKEIAELNCQKACITSTNKAVSGSQHQQNFTVCEVCGAFLATQDSDKRLADHFGGKVHLGFAAMRSQIEVLKDRINSASAIQTNKYNSKSENKRKNCRSPSIARIASSVTMQF